MNQSKLIYFPKNMKHIMLITTLFLFLLREGSSQEIESKVYSDIASPQIKQSYSIVRTLIYQSAPAQLESSKDLEESHKLLNFSTETDRFNNEGKSIEIVKSKNEINQIGEYWAVKSVYPNLKIDQTIPIKPLASKTEQSNNKIASNSQNQQIKWKKLEVHPLADFVINENGVETKLIASDIIKQTVFEAKPKVEQHKFKAQDTLQKQPPQTQKTEFHEISFKTQKEEVIDQKLGFMIFGLALLAIMLFVIWCNKKKGNILRKHKKQFNYFAHKSIQPDEESSMSRGNSQLIDIDQFQEAEFS